MNNDIQMIKQSTRKAYRHATGTVDMWRVFASIVLYTIIIAITWAFVVVYMSIL